MLARYLQGECTSTEAAAVEQWIAADPTHAAEVAALRAAFDRVTDDALWHGIAERMAEPPVRELRPRTSAPPHRISRPYIGLAAALVLAAAGLVVAQRANWFVSTQPFRDFVSAAGSRVTVTMRDGTQVVLGPLSRLRVPADFGSTTRTVTLDGEALFTVVHDAEHPFTVQTSRTTIRDVGTTFVVHAYGDDASDRIAVSEGEVALPGVSLQARDVAVVDTKGHIDVERNADVGPYVGWIQGTLIFRRTPLRDAAKDVARVYDLDIRIADSTLAGALVTGSFGGQTAEAVLSAMTYVVGAHFERTGRTVVIRRGVVPTQRRGAGKGADVRLTQAGGAR